MITHQQAGFAVLERFRRAGENHHVAFAQHGRRHGLLAENSIAAIAVTVTSSRSSARSASVLPTLNSARRQHHRVQLLVAGCAVLDHSRIVAAEQPPQHRVPVVADVADSLDDARHRDIEQQQHVRHQHQARFQRFRHDLGGARLLQLLELRVVLSSHQDRQVRPQLAYRFDDLHRRCDFRERQDQHAAALQSDCLQHLVAVPSPRSPDRRRAAPARRRADPNRARRTRSPDAPARAPGSGRRGRSRRR